VRSLASHGSEIAPLLNHPLPFQSPQGMGQMGAQPFIGVGRGEEECDRYRSSRSGSGPGSMGMPPFSPPSSPLPVKPLRLAVQMAAAIVATVAESVTWR
jgi:hypothetical protein